MIYGYARISTKGDYQTFDRQIKMLREAGVPDGNVLTETASGYKDDRPVYNALKDKLAEGDTLVVAEASRISRSTQEFCKFLDFVKERHICLQIIGSITLDCTSGAAADPMQDAYLKMAAVFADLEGRIIRQRVIEGIEAAKARGSKLGRKAITWENMPKESKYALKKYFPLWQSGEISKNKLAAMLKVSHATAYKYIDIYENKLKADAERREAKSDFKQITIAEAIVAKTGNKRGSEGNE